MERHLRLSIFIPNINFDCMKTIQMQINFV